MEFEHTPGQMAAKLMGFIRDFSTDASCDEYEQKIELEHVTALFDKLQKSEEFNILVHHLDIMFAHSEFDCK